MVIDENRGGETGIETLRRMMTIRYMLPSRDVGFVSHAWFRLFHI